MKNLKKIKNIGLLFLTLGFSFFILTGCGYKPSSHYAKKEINGKVYVYLVVNIEDPKNSVLIKDALNELLVNKLDAHLVYKESQADTVMNIKLDSVSLSELSYGDDGYAKLYAANVNISVDYKKRAEASRSLSVTGRYDFSIDDGATISETKRFEAVRSASNKALDELISKIAVLTFKSNEKKESN